MRIKYLGHACFIIISDGGVKIITDPYASGGGLDYGEIRESADIVTVSHAHSDHNNAAAIPGNPKIVRGAATVKGIEFKAIPCAHDDAGGKLRGKNTIFSFEVDGIRVCHLGDLGHQLSEDQLAELDQVDILLIPVGGFYTIDAKIATELCDQLKPKVVIPMHYKTDKCAYPIAGVEEFLQGKKEVTRLDASQAEFRVGELPATTRIIVLKPAL